MGRPQKGKEMPPKLLPDSSSGSFWLDPLLVSSVLMVVMLYCNLSILVPFERAEEGKSGSSRGNFSDLYPRWMGARELLLYGHDPYSLEVTREIQLGYYGRALDPTHAADPKDEQRFVYPLYVVFFLAPFVHLPFEVVRRIFTLLLAGLVAWAVFLWPSITGLQWKASTKVATVLVVFSTLQVMQGVARLQLSLLVFALLSSAISAVARGRLCLGGFMLALATIKPQLVLLPVTFLLFWSIARRRRIFLWSFAAGLAALVVAADLVQHGWIVRFWQAVKAYRKYAAGSPLEFVFPPAAAWTLTLFTVAFAVAHLWRAGKAESDCADFQVALALAMAVTTVVAPIGGGYNQLFLLPAFLGLLANRSRFQNARLAEAVLFWSPWIVFALPWVAAIFVIVLHLMDRTSATIYRLPYLFAFMLPFFVTAAISLVGVKLWANGPPGRDTQGLVCR